MQPHAHRTEPVINAMTSSPNPTAAAHSVSTSTTHPVPDAPLGVLHIRERPSTATRRDEQPQLFPLAYDWLYPDDWLS